MSHTLFKPFPKQEEFLADCMSGDYDFVLYGGAIRGGKTFGLLGLFLILCKMYPGSRWAIVRADLPVIKRNTYPSWDKIKPDHFVKKHDHETHTVTMVNGSQIIFFPETFAADKELNRWKGLEVNGVGFEEINECQEVSFYKAFERAGAYVIPVSDNNPEPVQPRPFVCGTCNPTRGWVKDLVYTPFKEGTLKPRWKYIQSTIHDNKPLLEAQPNIIQQYKDNLPRHEYMQFVDGDWDVQVKTGGECYKSFELDSHVRKLDYNASQALHVSFDENVNPYLPAGVFQVRTINDTKGKSTHKVRMIKEFAMENPKNTVKHICQAICREYEGHSSGMMIYGDATSKKQDTKLEKGQNFFTIILAELQVFKPTLRVPAANPSVQMRLRWLNAVLELNTGGITIEIDEGCSKTIEDLMLIKENPDGTKNKPKKRDPKTLVTYEEHGHFSDIFDYFCCAAFNGEYAIWQSGSIETRVSVGRRKPSKHGY